jgi:hypothetical protein
MSLNKNERFNIDNQISQLYELKTLSEEEVKFVTDKVNFIEKIGKRNIIKRR